MTNKSLIYNYLSRIFRGIKITDIVDRSNDVEEIYAIGEFEIINIHGDWMLDMVDKPNYRKGEQMLYHPGVGNDPNGGLLECIEYVASALFDKRLKISGKRYHILISLNPLEQKCDDIAKQSGHLPLWDDNIYKVDEIATRYMICEHCHQQFSINTDGKIGNIEVLEKQCIPTSKTN